ncbi:MAG: hypothetical protein JEZ03_14705 [Bacteroidales bacterium]|nr:hypothetical protein [Bacteroidales bacterium]
MGSLLDIPEKQWGYQFSYTPKGWLNSSTFGVYKHNNTHNDNITNNVGGEPIWVSNTNYSTSYSYDKNGNITELNRNAYGTTGYQMDELTFNYNKVHGKLVNNQLQYVDDAIAGAPFETDMRDQAPGNYLYDPLGRLMEDKQTNVAYQYTATSHLAQAKYPAPNRDAPWTMDYKYNESGFRICKQQGTQNDVYVRDVGGNILAVYNKLGNNAAELIEVPIYASGRVGVYKEQLGKTLYKLKDHLGNVRVVFRKGLYSNAVKLNETDYYPFGFEMPGRNTIAENYRFGFQGEFAEKDEETGFNHFELRAYDSRLGRWMVTDPANQYASPYMGMGNMPHMGVDPDGAFFTHWLDEDGNIVHDDHIDNGTVYRVDEGYCWDGQDVNALTDNSRMITEGWSWQGVMDNKMGINDYEWMIQSQINLVFFDRNMPVNYDRGEGAGQFAYGPHTNYYISTYKDPKSKSMKLALGDVYNLRSSIEHEYGHRLQHQGNMVFNKNTKELNAIHYQTMQETYIHTTSSYRLSMEKYFWFNFFGGIYDMKTVLDEPWNHMFD